MPEAAKKHHGPPATPDPKATAAFVVAFGLHAPVDVVRSRADFDAPAARVVASLPAFWPMPQIS